MALLPKPKVAQAEATSEIRMDGSIIMIPFLEQVFRYTIAKKKHLDTMKKENMNE
jgi:hypothetical protein